MSEVRAKKALGQHFLVDLNIARKICDALSGGVYPFIALDLAKIVVSCIVGALLRKRLVQAGVLKLKET